MGKVEGRRLHSSNKDKAIFLKIKHLIKCDN